MNFHREQKSYINWNELSINVHIQQILMFRLLKSNVFPHEVQFKVF
jgi:hypothetical protein